MQTIPTAKNTLVTTTIRLPKFVPEVCENIVKHGHRDETAWLVIGDTKTPPESDQICKEATEKYGVPVTYLDIEAQEKALADVPEIFKLIPRGCYVRKFLGSFLAWRQGCETMIQVDDDNFVTDADFVGGHEIVGSERELPLVSSPTGWFNVYEALEEARGIPIFPRGFPWSERSAEERPRTVETKKIRVALNNGFVLEDPDIDAVSRLFWPIRTTGMSPGWNEVVALAPGTWSSSNNQNTATHRDATAAFFMPALHGEVAKDYAMSVHGPDRNNDIWSSYVMNRIAEHLGEAVTFGAPLVKQFRNPHDLWKDLADELINIRATDAFCETLRSVQLTQKTWLGALEELLAGALEKAFHLPPQGPGEAEMIVQFLREYQIWHGIVAKNAGRAAGQAVMASHIGSGAGRPEETVS